MMYCITNKNSREEGLDVMYLLMAGASTDRDLTGQGFGTKMIGISCAANGLLFKRSSHDKDGPYIAWYEIEPYMAGETERKRAVFVVQRPEKELERVEMTIDVGLVQNEWARNPLGDTYPTIREPLLDAADEDADFSIGKCDEVEYAPLGYTVTYIEDTEDLEYLMQAPDYYFRKVRGEITWLSDSIGIGDVSSRQETRLYITAGDDPVVAYAAWSSGDDQPEPAYDYILLERDDLKWASMPKRVLESIHDAQNAIMEAVRKCGDVSVVAKVLENIVDGGWEASMSWSTAMWQWNKTVLHDAVRTFTHGRPIHMTELDEIFLAARVGGYDPIALPTWLYKLAAEAGITTASNVLGYREEGEVRFLTMDPHQRKLVMGALDALEAKIPWVKWRGHVVMAMEVDDGFDVVHEGNAIPVDTIGINFDARSGWTIQEVAELIAHAMIHHNRHEHGTSGDYHYKGFSETALKMLLPPME